MSNADFQPGAAQAAPDDAEVPEPSVPELTAEVEPVPDLPLSDEGGELTEIARQRDAYLDALRRVQAEFDNYRKRVDRQYRDTVELAATSLVKKLLPVLDTADLALAHGGGEDVKQLAAALFDTLAKEGLERIDPEGQPFDPEHHEAVAHEPGTGEANEEGPQVSEVLRAGYRWKGRALRPAMVKVRG